MKLKKGLTEVVGAETSDNKEIMLIYEKSMEVLHFYKNAKRIGTRGVDIKCEEIYGLSSILELDKWGFLFSKEVKR